MIKTAARRLKCTLATRVDGKYLYKLEDTGTTDNSVSLITRSEVGGVFKEGKEYLLLIKESTEEVLGNYYDGRYDG